MAALIEESEAIPEVLAVYADIKATAKLIGSIIFRKRWPIIPRH
jgi:hypothetical protein